MKTSTYSSTNVYKIMEVLGEGSSGTVYKAEKQDESGQISTIVALKVLNSNELTDIWRREFQSLKQVRSHNCVHVFGFERVMDKPALSLEYVEGLSLQELTGYGVLTGELITEITCQILDGLEDLWDQGLFHGDLSPANVLVSTSGVVKLLDFGLGNRSETKTLATPHFTAPEVASGKETARSSDLYSLGRVIEYLGIGEESNKSFQQTVDRLTQKDAGQRRRPEIKPSVGGKEVLAEFVRQAYRQKKFELEPTKEFVVKSVAIPLQKNSQITFRRRYVSVALLVIALFFMGVGLKWLVPVEAEPSNLKIRSNSWYKVSIDGKDYGYTPIDVELSSGKVSITWEGPFGKGERVLTLESGENKVIDDTFFGQKQGD